MEKEKYVVIETGGSIGEIANRGHTRLGSFTIFDDKEEAKAKTRSMSKAYGGVITIITIPLKLLVGLRRISNLVNWRT